MTIISNDHTVQLASPATTPGISAVLTSAFWDDPVFRWAIPDDEHRWDVLPELFDVFVDGFVPLGATHTTASGVGAALWAPPGTHADLDALGRLAPELPRMLPVMELLESTHPDEPCWYLNLLGVETGSQGQGIGSALLRTVLEAADAEGVPAYLEATSPANRRLYEQHGFVVTAELRTQDCPPLWAMWHRPG